MTARVQWRHLSLVLAVFWALLLPTAVRAQDSPPINISNASVDFTFGQQAEFHLEASAPAGIDSIYLFIRAQGETGVEVHTPSIEPGTTVRATVKRDLRLYPFPPFGQVLWWWEIRDRSDHILEMEPTPFHYIDNRFQWHLEQDGPVRVHTVVDDPAYQQTALTVARTALEQISPELQAPPVEQVDIYIYPSQEDIRAALQMAGREWVAGQARPELGVILVAIPPGDSAFNRMERDIPHELTHYLIYRTVGTEGYHNIPPWLEEGLATANELRPDASLEVVLENARSQGRLIPLTQLCDPFPADPETAYLSYAQSASLVRYIRERYGGEGVRALLAAYADGAGCEGGIIQALDITPQRLQLAWRAQLIGLSGWMTWLSENRTWLMMWGVSLLLALPMMGQLQRRGGAEPGTGGARE